MSWRRDNCGPYALYRMFSADDALLYIGQSHSPMSRPQELSKYYPWPRKIARVTLEWFDTRAEVVAAETAAIKAERPQHNVQHNTAPRADFCYSNEVTQ